MRTRKQSGAAGHACPKFKGIEFVFVTFFVNLSGFFCWGPEIEGCLTRERDFETKTAHLNSASRTRFSKMSRLPGRKPQGISGVAESLWPDQK